jgi:hypothetical protein
MKNTKKITLIALLTLTTLLNVYAEAPAHPNVNVWMSYWSRSFKEQNEFCQPNSQSCGQTNSMLPRKLFYNFDFNLSDSFINFVAIGAKRYVKTGPIYHLTSNWEQFLAGPTNNTTGYDIQINDYGNGTTGSTNAITNSITIAPQYFTMVKANGYLSVTNYFDNDVYNKMELTDTSVVTFQHKDGNENFIYTYKVFFTMWEVFMNGLGYLENGSDIHWNEMLNDHGPVYNGYYEHPGFGFSGYIKVTIRGGSSNKIIVTPRANRPYYEYQIKGVFLDSYIYDEK